MTWVFDAEEIIENLDGVEKKAQGIWDHAADVWDDIKMRGEDSSRRLLSSCGCCCFTVTITYWKDNKKKKNRIACLYSDGSFPLWSTLYSKTFPSTPHGEDLGLYFPLKRVGGLGNIVGSSQLNVYKFSNCCPFFLIQKC